MSGAITVKDQKIVCSKSGNRCAFPDCRKEIVRDGNGKDPAVIIGELAHIRGEKPGSARYDSTYKNPNCHENLIFACPTCHTKIDKQTATYTVDVLLSIKREHEDWVRDSLKSEVVNVSFAELSIVTKYLVSGQCSPSISFIVVPPPDKIKKNNLSSEVEVLITMGMSQVNQVADFINRCPDAELGERLKQGFVEKYEVLKNTEGLTGDDLFNALLDFSSGGSNDFKEKAAGLAVLVYLFEKCEVFEK